MYRSFYASINWYFNHDYNAVWAFKKTMNKFKNDYSTLFVVFDSGKSFRCKIDKNYKAQRIKMPDNLFKQFSILKAELKIAGIRIFQKRNYEADDLMGILCYKLKDKVDKITILSVDKDLNQLINDKVNILKYKHKKWILYSEKDVINDYGIKPNQFADFLAIIGDKADNIPKGIPGVGPKGATKILQKYNSISKLILNKQYMIYKNKLLKNLRLTKILITI